MAQSIDRFHLFQMKIT